MHIYIVDQPDTDTILSSDDAKCKIATYQLWKSQFIFTLAEQHSIDSFPVPIPYTSITSQIMIDTRNYHRDFVLKQYIFSKQIKLFLFVFKVHQPTIRLPKSIFFHLNVYLEKVIGEVVMKSSLYFLV